MTLTVRIEFADLHIHIHNHVANEEEIVRAIKAATQQVVENTNQLSGKLKEKP